MFWNTFTKLDLDSYFYYVTYLEQKQYAALVWISRPLEDEDSESISSLKDTVSCLRSSYLYKSSLFHIFLLFKVWNMIPLVMLYFNGILHEAVQGKSIL